MLFTSTLITDTKGLSIFTAVKSYLEKNDIPMHNIVACATDGAPSMMGRYRGFVAFLKEEVPNALYIHCVIHRQHLVGKHLSTRLHESLNVIIKTINKIKSNAKNDRMFRQLCQDNNEQFIRLLLHTEVRWLSKGTCLTHFAELYDSVVQFLESEHEIGLCTQLKAIKHDAFYLAWIFKKFNEINLKLQGTDVTLITCKDALTLFIKKLDIFRHNLLQGEFHQFPELLTIKNDVTPEDIERFGNHLSELKLDMEKRFCDILNLKVYDWIINPFTANAANVDVTFQEELLEMQFDEESKTNYNNGEYQKLWQNKKMTDCYPNMWKMVRNLLLPFPTSYLVESGFSAVNNIITKHRNRLRINERGDLRLLLTKIEPDIQYLVAQHQAQGSH